MYLFVILLMIGELFPTSCFCIVTTCHYENFMYFSSGILPTEVTSRLSLHRNGTRSSICEISTLLDNAMFFPNSFINLHLMEYGAVGSRFSTLELHF